MSEKSQIIHELKNVKLVLGNGFDLHCHLRTRYSDYFNYKKDIFDFIERWFGVFCNNTRFFADDRKPRFPLPRVEGDSFEKLSVNVWDMFFYFSSKDDKNIEDKRWCDVEATLLTSLSSKITNDQQGECIKWNNVYQILTGHLDWWGMLRDDSKMETVALASFIEKKNNYKLFSSEREFYSSLLAQFKLFEADFGRYVYHQHNDDHARSFGIIKPNTCFASFSKLTMKNLCNIENLVSVDTFNYDAPDIPEIESIVHNINGDVESPIFGVDSEAFDASEPQYIFTKTSRRMELDMIRGETQEMIPFDNIIVFGHSLNRADYSYFFSVLDRMDIVRLEKPSRIVFAFSIYDDKKAHAIKESLRKNIINLFSDYSKYKGNQANPKRLLDSLTTQGKVLMYEIPYQVITHEPGYFGE